MAPQMKVKFIPLYLLAIAHLCNCEFVPVYMWGTHSTTDPVPALHKLSQNSFKDEISEKLKSNPTLIIFAEQSLSPEDFGQRDRFGNSPFSYLSKVKKFSKVTYLPYVQNPIKAIRHSSEDVSEISIEELGSDFDIPDTKIIIVSLNDAKENEQRFDMLKRHDSVIASIYDKILSKHENVLSFYTAHRASWIGSGEIHSRKTRAVDTGDAAANQLFDSGVILLYSSGPAVVSFDTESHELNLDYTANKNNGTISLSGIDNSTETNKFELSFVSSSTGYWYLQHLYLQYETKNFTLTTNSIYAPFSFSYACGDQTFGNSSLSIMLPQFQIQPIFLNTSLNSQLKFDDPYNCVGFTTIPIWSGLFVTFILMIIMSMGLTMMMDIKTMDKYDDAKGKTITINVSE